MINKIKLLKKGGEKMFRRITLDQVLWIIGTILFFVAYLNDNLRSLYSTSAVLYSIAYSIAYKRGY